MSRVLCKYLVANMKPNVRRNIREKMERLLRIPATNPSLVKLMRYRYLDLTTIEPLKIRELENRSKY